MASQIFPNITPSDTELMEQLLREGKIYHKYAIRLQVVLCRSRNVATKDISNLLKIQPVTVSRYVKRYNEGGVYALLHDKTRKPGKTPISTEIKNEISRLVCNEKPHNATHWSTRELAAKVGISHDAVARILRERQLKPHLVKRFQFSNDSEFSKKLDDVVGLYLDPPENSIVFCVDEKSQIQALERSQPILPILPGVPERQTHDYYRHGTTTLFAALNVLTGKVIGDCRDKHKGEDFIAFLELIDKKSPKHKTLHIISDNYSAHKTKDVKEFVESKNGRFVLHFTPTHSSWPNLVERFFAEITNKRIRRESWTSKKELEKAILKFIHDWNKSDKKFVWIKSAKDIEKSIEKAKSY